MNQRATSYGVALFAMKTKTSSHTAGSSAEYFIGIDNGVSGSVAVVDRGGALLLYEPTPLVNKLNYTKTKSFVNLVDTVKLEAMLRPYITGSLIIERPMINPGRWGATVSAIRCHTLQEDLFDRIQIRYRFVDSKEWQKQMLPEGLKGSAELKKASLHVGRRRFPTAKFKKDADAALMAEYARQKNI